MISKVGEIVARIRNDWSWAERVNEDTDLINEIGLDSLELIDFLLALENEFQIEVDFNLLEMSHLTSVKRLCCFVETSRSHAVSSQRVPSSV